MAESQPFGFGSEAEVLCEEGCIDQCRDEPQEVAVGLVALVDAAIVVVAVDVGADGEEHGCRRTLAEVELAEVGAEGLFLGGYDAVKLHVARVGGTDAAIDDFFKEFGADLLVGEFAYGTVVEHEAEGVVFHVCMFFLMFSICKSTKKK